jgi:hypothetical protein
MLVRLVRLNQFIILWSRIIIHKCRAGAEKSSLRLSLGRFNFWNCLSFQYFNVISVGCAEVGQLVASYIGIHDTEEITDSAPLDKTDDHNAAPIIWAMVPWVILTGSA